MEKIKQLSTEVIHQIAAGEVLERPSHLVKELIENSIDAGADSIELSYEDGGMSLSVKDNGCGISRDDLPLSIARHATSKLSLSSDIWRLKSFGFRGEALASMAAVSEMDIISREKTNDEANKLSIHFGDSYLLDSIGGEVGTSISVKSLFKNLPARKKFLKSQSAESAHIKKTFKALALVHPHISFKLKQSGKLVYHWVKQKQFVHRVEDVLNINGLHSIAKEDNGYKLRLTFSSPNVTIGTRQQIWIFVQKRWIQNATIIAAILESYRNLLMHGEYPYAILDLEVPTEEIDVNIHPSKSQVKFQDNSKVFRFIHLALREALESAPWVDKMLGARSVPRRNHVNTNPSLKFESSDFEKIKFRNKDFISEEKKETNPLNKHFENKNMFVQFGKMHNIFEDTISPISQSDTHEGTKITNQWKNIDIIGQVHQTYIVGQTSDALLMIDQHAAHERVVFEKLMERFKKQKMDMQQFFLIPLYYENDEGTIELLFEIQKDLLNIGLKIERSGPTTLSLTSAPLLIKEKALIKVLDQVAQDISIQGKSFALEKYLGDIFATMACHSVIRAGQSMSYEEMKSLLKQMDEYPFSSFCPHGRPVFVEYPWGRIEREFGRIV